MGYKQCTVLIPLREDKEVGNGQLHPPRRWKSFEDALEARWGFTADPNPKRGVWKDPETGRRVADRSYLYTIAVPEEEIPALKKYLVEARKLFKQKCIYFECGGDVEFV